MYYKTADLLRVWCKNLKERVKLSAVEEHKAV